MEKVKKCLIIVDYQNDFVSGSLGFEAAIEIEELIESKIKNAITEGIDIIFTFDTHQSNYLETQEGKNLPIEHCIDETFGHQLYGKIAKYLKNAAAIFKKPTFGSLELGKYLEVNQYNKVELCGLVTNMCVLSNAVIAKAALPEALIIVDQEASKSFNQDLHDQAINILRALQVTIK